MEEQGVAYTTSPTRQGTYAAVPRPDERIAAEEHRKAEQKIKKQGACEAHSACLFTKSVSRRNKDKEKSLQKKKQAGRPNGVAAFNAAGVIGKHLTETGPSSMQRSTELTARNKIMAIYIVLFSSISGASARPHGASYMRRRRELKKSKKRCILQKGRWSSPHYGVPCDNGGSKGGWLTRRRPEEEPPIRHTLSPRVRNGLHLGREVGAHKTEFPVYNRTRASQTGSSDRSSTPSSAHAKWGVHFIL